MSDDDYFAKYATPSDQKPAASSSGEDDYFSKYAVSAAAPPRDQFRVPSVVTQAVPEISLPPLSIEQQADIIPPRKPAQESAISPPPAGSGPAPEPPPAGSGPPPGPGPHDSWGEFPKAAVGTLIGQNPKLFGDFLEAFGLLTGSSDMQRMGTDIAQYGEGAMKQWAPRIPSYRDISTASPGAFLTDTLAYLGGAAGQSLSSMAPGLAIGGAVGAATANPIIGIAAGVAGPSYIQNGGDVYGSLKTDPDVAAAVQQGRITQRDLASIAAMAAIPMAALDATSLFTVLTSAGMAAPAANAAVASLKADIKKTLVQKMIHEGVKDMTVEGITEGAQEIISQGVQAYTGESSIWDRRRWDSVVDNIIGGMLGGGITGTAAGANRHATQGDRLDQMLGLQPGMTPEQQGAALGAAIGAFDPNAVQPTQPAPVAPGLPPNLSVQPTESAAAPPPAAPPPPVQPRSEPVTAVTAPDVPAVAPDQPVAVLPPPPPPYADPAEIDQAQAEADAMAARQRLADALGDPRTADELHADRAQQEIARVRDIQAQLPPGFGVRRTTEEADGEAGWAITDPDGIDLETTNQLTADRVTEWVNLAKATDAEFDFSESRRIGDGTKAAPIVVQSPSDVTAAAAQAVDPTPAQAAAGNYKMGHLELHGLDIAIETAAGATRSGIDPDGSAWSVQMPAHYGYIKGVPGADGDKIDVYIGPDPGSGLAVVVDQIDARSGKFDEHKILLGFPDAAAAIDTYRRGFSDGIDRVGAATEMSVDDLKQWLKSGDMREPLAYVEDLPPAEPPAAAPEPAEPPAPPPAAPETTLIQSTDLGQDLFAEIHRRDDGKFAVTLRDVDAGLTLPVVRIFPSAKQAKDYVRKDLIEQGQPPAPPDAPASETVTPPTAEPTTLAPEQEPAPTPTTEPATEPTAPKGYGSPESPNFEAITDALVEAFLSNRYFSTIARARQFITADLLGGQGKVPDAMLKPIDEAIEAAVVRAARRIVAEGKSPQETFDRLLTLYQQQPTLASRTSSSIENQAYSTPVPLAYVAARLAEIGETTSVLEPTAGNGALLITATPRLATANELDASRRAELERQGFEASDQDAVSAEWPGGVEAVIANPPFGTRKTGQGTTEVFDLGGNYETREIDHAIALHALEAMADNGSAVLILGGIARSIQTPKARSDAYHGKAKREFYARLYRQYNVVDHVTVGGRLYARQGAEWPVDLIVIRGRGRSQLSLPAANLPRQLASWEAVKELLDDQYQRADMVEPDARPEPGGGSGSGDAVEPGPVSGPADAAAVGPDFQSVGSGGGDVDGSRRVRGRRSGAAAGPTVESGVSGERPGEGTGLPVEPQSAGSELPADDQGPRTAGPEPGAAAELPREPGPASAGTPGLTEPAAPPKRAPRKAEIGVAQVPYQPFSQSKSVDSLVPTNLQTAISGGLEALEGKVGTLDEFVGGRLGYSREEMGSYFSGEQVDAIALAMDNLDRGAAFIIGDQTGIGKGRVVAAMIRYAMRQGIPPIFVTVDPSLFKDMNRDLTDIGMPAVRIFATKANLRVDLTDDGSRTLSTGDLASQAKAMAGIIESLDQGKGLGAYDAVFTTYSQMQTVKGEPTGRMAFLQRVARGGFLILDESHNAGGSAADETDDRLTRAKFAREMAGAAKSVFFSSATFAKRPDVMSLYARTDLGQAVSEGADLAELMAAGGIPMQQVVSAMLAEARQYIRRERSFAGVDYDTPIVPVPRKSYETFSDLIHRITRFELEHIAPARSGIAEQVKGSAALVTGDGSIGGAGISSTNFTSVVHNLIEQMLLAIKAQAAVERAVEAFRAGKKPVLTVSNTMGSAIGDLADLLGVQPGGKIDATFGRLLDRYLDRTRVYSERRPFMKKGEKAEKKYIDDEMLGPDGVAAFSEIRKRIASADLSDLPLSPIDYIISGLEAAGLRVAEITGREDGLSYGNGGTYYRVRPPTERTTKARVTTIQGFNNGDIDALILNQSGSTGISLHASERVKDQRPRTMIIVQAEKNIDTHMQMLGRVHRTGQVVTPSYTQMVADIPAEKRPAAVLAKKMRSLNATTTAATESAVTAKDVPDFLNPYGDQVVANILAESPDLIDLIGVGVDVTPTGRVVGTPDLARKVTGRIPLIPSIAQQEELYDQIETAYRSYVAEKEAAGENALEAKTLDLDMKVIESRVLVPAAPKVSGPFAAKSTLVKADIKKTTKPPTTAKVREMIAEAKPADDVLKAVDKQQQIRQQIINSDSSELVKERSLESLGRQTERLLAVYEELAGGSRGIGNVNPIGETVKVATDIGNLYGVVLGLRKVGKAKNPVALGSWEIQLLLTDGARRNIPLSNVYTPDNTPGSPEPGTVIVARARMIGDIPIMDMFDAGQSSRRETRWMVTGNLVSGFQAVKGRGAIVNFTTAENEVRQGILLPANFDPKKDLKTVERKFQDAAAVLDYVRAQNQSYVQITAQNDILDLQFQRWGNGDFSLVAAAPAAKSVGGVVYLNRDIRKITGDWVKSGRVMRVSMDPSEARPFLDQVMKMPEVKLINPATPEPEEAAAEDFAEAVAAAVEAGDITELHAGVDPTPIVRALWKATKAHRTQVALAARQAWRDFVSGARLRAEVIGSPADSRTIGILRRWLYTPQNVFRGTPVASLFDYATKALTDQQNWINRLMAAYSSIGDTIVRDGGRLERVVEALWQGDADELNTNDPVVLGLLQQQFDLNAAEVRGFRRFTRLLNQLGRIVDMHNRSMLPGLRRQKMVIWRKLEALANTAVLYGNADFMTLYRRRSYLVSRIKALKGDLSRQAAEVAGINEKLDQFRLDDPALQAELDALRQDYNVLEARVANKTIRTRGTKGYVPHKFFGGWRVFERIADPADPTSFSWREITSDQGFYDSEYEATEAVRSLQEKNPAGFWRISKKAIQWPFQTEGTELSDKNYFRFLRAASEATQLEGQDLLDAMKGVARKRFRRRIFDPARHRGGAEGFSQDFPRVMQAHILQTVRYVTMDRFKSKAINLQEAAGLSRNKRLTQEQRELAAAVESYIRDVNGEKQSAEAQLDRALEVAGRRPWRSALAAAAVVGISGAAAIHPMVGVLAGGYAGRQVFRAMTQGGSFPTRFMINEVLSHTAHLKLGMFLNLRSAFVNLTQVILNTYPLLGAKATTAGYRRALAALNSSRRYQRAMKRAKTESDEVAARELLSPDAVLMHRANIYSRYNFDDATHALLESDSRIARLSMFWFQGAETINRAATFFAAMSTPEAKKASPGQALRYAMSIVRKTQFDYSNADKSELMRQLLLKLPLQMKNYLAHQIAFVFDLGRDAIQGSRRRRPLTDTSWRDAGRYVQVSGKEARARVGRFLLAMTLASGLVGLPIWMLDEVQSWMTGFSVVDHIKAASVDMMARGWGWGEAMAGLLYGLPGLANVDISGSVGMGDKTLPSRATDLLGPWAGTLKQQLDLTAQGASLVDHLRALTPIGTSFKALEAAANGVGLEALISNPAAFWSGLQAPGFTWDSPYSRQSLVYRPSRTEMASKVAGFMPLRETMLREQRDRARTEAEQSRLSTRPGENRIAEAIQQQIAITGSLKGGTPGPNWFLQKMQVLENAGKVDDAAIAKALGSQGTPEMVAKGRAYLNASGAINDAIAGMQGGPNPMTPQRYSAIVEGVTKDANTRQLRQLPRSMRERAAGRSRNINRFYGQEEPP